MKTWKDQHFVIPSDLYHYIIDNSKGKSEKDREHINSKGKRIAYESKLIANNFIRRMIAQGKHYRAL